MGLQVEQLTGCTQKKNRTEGNVLASGVRYELSLLLRFLRQPSITTQISQTTIPST